MMKIIMIPVKFHPQPQPPSPPLPRQQFTIDHSKAEALVLIVLCEALWLLNSCWASFFFFFYRFVLFGVLFLHLVDTVSHCDHLTGEGRAGCFAFHWFVIFLNCEDQSVFTVCMYMYMLWISIKHPEKTNPTTWKRRLIQVLTGHVS